jgi:NAD(P)H dehydrogenase (quinone)
MSIVITGATGQLGRIGAGVPAAFAEILVDVDDAISRGALAATPGDLSRLIGRPTTPIADSIAAAPASPAS